MQLAQEEVEPSLAIDDLNAIVDATEGRSAVNLVRVVSTAAQHAGGLPVSFADFDLALMQEPSDYDDQVARANAKYDEKHGWRGCHV